MQQLPPGESVFDRDPITIILSIPPSSTSKAEDIGEPLALNEPTLDMPKVRSLQIETGASPNPVAVNSNVHDDDDDDNVVIIASSDDDDEVGVDEDAVQVRCHLL